MAIAARWKDPALDANQLAAHSAFDAPGRLAAALMTFWLTRRARIDFPTVAGQRSGRYAALGSASAVEAHLFGTLNLIAYGRFVIARSIEGAIFGAGSGVAFCKRFKGVKARSGARFAPALAIGVAVGRFARYCSGIEDLTCGTPANWPWRNVSATAFCAAQRFVREFFKPHAPALEPSSVFQILSIMPALYALFMLLTASAQSHESSVRA